MTYLIGMISASDLALSIASFMTGGITLSSWIDSIYPTFNTAPLIFLNVLCNLLAFFSFTAYFLNPFDYCSYYPSIYGYYDPYPYASKYLYVLQ
jgi:hypothetical protein